jgi:predicted lipoprotein with Yx(FWY)xxD motif
MSLPRISLAAVCLVLLAGCATSSPSSALTTTEDASGPLTVTTALTSTGVPYLADNNGMAVYLFGNDTSGVSTCTGGCLTAWPPVPGSAERGPTLRAALTTLTRADGTKQAVYNGHPLYYFQGDKQSGQTNGQAVKGDGGVWYLVDQGGDPIKDLAAAAPPPGGGMGGY